MAENKWVAEVVILLIEVIFHPIYNDRRGGSLVVARVRQPGSPGT